MKVLDGFSERQAAPLPLRVSSAVLVVIEAILVVSLWPDLGTAPWVVTAGIALIGAVVLVVGCFLFTLQIRTDVGDEQVELALWPYWRVRLRVSDLSSQAASTSPRTWKGIGLRRGRGPSGQVYRALLFDAGPAVFMLDNSSGVTYVVRSDRTDRLLQAMRRGLRPDAAPAPDRPDDATRPSVDPAISYPAIFVRLQASIPSAGEAATVQAELLRAVQNLEDEARRNGNQNWDDRYQRQLDYLRDHLTDGTLTGSRSTIALDLDAIAHIDPPQTDPAVWARLINASCEWSLAHPSLLKRTSPDPAHDIEREIALPQDGRSVAAWISELGEVIGAWSHSLVSSSAVVLTAAELLVETDDDTTLVPIAALPPAVERDDLWAVIREAFAVAGTVDLLEKEQLELSALAWLCRQYLAAEIPGLRVVTWASARSRRSARGLFDAFTGLDDALDSGMPHHRFEHELRDQAAAFLLGRPRLRSKT